MCSVCAGKLCTKVGICNFVPGYVHRCRYKQIHMQLGKQVWTAFHLKIGKQFGLLSRNKQGYRESTYRGHSRHPEEKCGHPGSQSKSKKKSKQASDKSCLSNFIPLLKCSMYRYWNDFLPMQTGSAVSSMTSCDSKRNTLPIFIPFHNLWGHPSNSSGNHGSQLIYLAVSSKVIPAIQR